MPSSENIVVNKQNMVPALRGFIVLGEHRKAGIRKISCTVVSAGWEACRVPWEHGWKSGKVMLGGGVKRLAGK